MAVPEAIKRVSEAVRALPPDERLIESDDLLYDGDKNDAGTETWYDFISPGLLIAGDNDMVLVGQWMQLTPGAFHKGEGTDGGRDSDDFTHILDHLVKSVGRDVTALPANDGAIRAP